MFPPATRWPSASASISGRVRVQDRRFLNDAGWFSFRGVSDLAAGGYVLSDREGDVLYRLDAYASRGKRNVVRCLGMLGASPWVNAGLAFSPSHPKYEWMREEIVSEANARGIYVNWCLFADAQIVVPDHNDRKTLVREFAAFCREHPGVIPGIANEAFKNGWTSAVDPALIELAALFAEDVGHSDFSISDPGDGTDQDSSADTTAQLVTLSQHSNIVVLHPNRDYGTDQRWRRWCDHLEGMTDVMGQLAHGVAYQVEEPIGAAPQDIPGRRDSDPDALAAGPFISALCGFGGYTYHKIDSEIAVDALPGFYEPADVLARIPCSPDWRYFNDGWAGSPTEGITWVGKEGKMRHLVRGNQAWSIAYGEADYDSVKWRTGWVPRVEYSGPRIRVWSVNL